MRASPSAYPTLSLKTKSPSHLVLRNGTWHFRMAVPGPCRPRLGGLIEFKASLKTGVLSDAKLLAGKLAANTHLVYLHAQNDSSQLETRDKKAIRALAKKWLLDGLDYYEAEHLSCDTPIRAEAQVTHNTSLGSMPECYQQQLPSGCLSCGSKKFIVEHFERENPPISEKDLLEFMLRTDELSDDGVNISSYSSLCWPDEAVAEMDVSYKSDVGEVKTTNIKILDDFIYEVVDAYLEDNIFAVFQFVDVLPSLVTSWDLFLNYSPHPLAPSLKVILAEQFSLEERQLFEQILRPTVEAGQSPTIDRVAYLTARKLPA